MDREKELLASFIANFRRAKKLGDPIEYAKACKDLVDVYGSPEDVAEKLGIGRETVRILSKVVDLPAEVKELISKKEIPLTVAFDIVPLDRVRQTEVARAVSGLPFKDARAVIRHVSNNPDMPIESARDEALKDLERREANIVMIAFPRNIYDTLSRESENVPVLVKKIVEGWLKKEEPLDYPIIPKDDLVSLAVRLPRATYRALRKKARSPANLVEKVVFAWSKAKSKI